MKTKDAALVGIILLMAVRSLMKDYIHFHFFNWPTLLFYTLFITCGVILFRSIGHKTGRFWLLMIIYLIIFMALVLYNYL